MAFDPPIVSASVTSASLARIPAHLALADPDYDWIHFDVCDAGFTRHMTSGPPIVEWARTFTSCHFDVHLMVSRPDRLVDAMARAGANTFTFHPQTVDKPNELIRRIRAAGMRPGVALDPDTPFEDVRRLMGAVDQVTVMTASADHEGQGFRAELLERVRLACEERDRKGLDLLVAADGLLALDNLTAVKAAGADVFVVGSGIFATEDPSRAFATVRAALRDLSPGETEDGVTRQAPAPGPKPITFLKRRATGR